MDILKSYYIVLYRVVIEYVFHYIRVDHLVMLHDT